MAFAAKQKMVPSAINYGDIVALTSDEGGGGGGMRGFMQAEGHRDARLWLRETTATGQPPADYDGCLFEIVSDPSEAVNFMGAVKQRKVGSSGT